MLLYGTLLKGHPISTSRVNLVIKWLSDTLARMKEQVKTDGLYALIYMLTMG